MKKARNIVSGKNKTILNIAIVAVFSLSITFAFTGFDLSAKGTLLSIVYGLLIGFSLALGSGGISSSILKSFSGSKSVTKKYVQLILSVSLFILIDLLIINIIWFKITQDRTLIELFQSRYFTFVYFGDVSHFH